MSPHPTTRRSDGQGRLLDDHLAGRLIEDSDGNFQFAKPADEVHKAFNDEALGASAFLYGRGMYEVMEEPWTAAAGRDDLPEVEAEFARAYAETPRIVFSDTLESVPNGVRLVRRSDAEADLTRLKDETEGRLLLGGAGLAASLVDLIDEFSPVLMPVAVGGGKPFFPATKRLPLRLAGLREFASGAVLLRYDRES